MAVHDGVDPPNGGAGAQPRACGRGRAGTHRSRRAKIGDRPRLGGVAVAVREGAEGERCPHPSVRWLDAEGVLLGQFVPPFPSVADARGGREACMRAGGRSRVAKVLLRVCPEGVRDSNDGARKVLG